MLNLLFHLITDPLPLPISPAYEYLLLGAIGLFSFRAGWEASPGGKGGRFIHYAVRASVFVALWAAFYGGIVAFRWLKSNWVTVVYIFACSIFIGITAHIVITNIKRLKAEEKEETPNERNEEQRD